MRIASGAHRVLWLSTALLACADAGEAPATRVPSVVQIRVNWTDADGTRNSMTLGSGFVVSEQGHVVTAQHVAANARVRSRVLVENETAEIVAALPAREPGAAPETVALAVVSEDPGADLAILEPTGRSQADGARRLIERADGAHGGSGVARLSLGVVEVGAPVLLAGYAVDRAEFDRNPGRVVDERTLLGVAMNSEPEPGWVARLRERGIYLVDVDTQIGHSGSPVVLEPSGEVIGLCSAVLKLSGTERGVNGSSARVENQVTVVIPSLEIARMLRQHGIRWSSPG